MEVSETRLAVAIIAVFALGVLFSIFNGEYTADTGESLPLVFYVLAAASMLTGAMLILLFNWKIKNQNLKTLLKVLPEDEAKIISALLDEKRLEQNVLVAESGISKVKVSRVLSKMEARGIIIKKQMGNTNLIKLNI